LSGLLFRGTLKAIFMRAGRRLAAPGRQKLILND
jgi:hypothetical protein